MNDIAVISKQHSSTEGKFREAIDPNNLKSKLVTPFISWQIHTVLTIGNEVNK